MAAFRGSPVAGFVRSAQLEDPALEELEHRIRAFAAVKGYYLEIVVREMGRSAVAAWRPDLDALVGDLERGHYAGVIVPSLEHLGRPPSAALRQLARLRATSAWVAFLDDRGVPTDCERR